MIAPRSCPTAYCSNFYLDQLHAIEFAMTSTDEAFDNVDFSAVGITGHSMGGHATSQSAASFVPAKHKIVAALAQVAFNCFLRQVHFCVTDCISLACSIRPSRFVQNAQHSRKSRSRGLPGRRTRPVPRALASRPTMPPLPRTLRCF